MTLPTVEAPKVPARQEVDPELLEQFAVWLDQDAWQIDLQWSALTLNEQTLSNWRWTFLPAAKSAAKPKAGSATEADTDAAAIARWKAVWSGDNKALEPSEYETILLVLKELTERSPRICANACILGARLAPKDVPPERTWSLDKISIGAYPATPKTADTVTSMRVPTATRAAAAEAWSASVQRGEEVDAATALEPAGLELQRPGLPDEIRTTLWRTLAVSIPPDHIPQLSATLGRKWDNSPTGDALKRAALEACIVYGVAHADTMTAWDASLWPPQIEAVRHDSDPRNRQLFGRWLAFSQHPQAAAWLAAQLRDTEPMVRELALQSLGQLKSEIAQQELLQTAQHETGRPRAIAIQALAQHSLQDVLKFARDSSGDVRAAVARSVVHHPSEEAAMALRPLLSDTHTEVPPAALSTVEAWPKEWKLPLLFEAVRSGSSATRQTALFALRDAIPDLPDLPIDGPLDERDRAVRTIAQSYDVRLDFRSHPNEPHAEAAATRVENEARSTAVVEAVRQYLTASPQTLDSTEAWDRMFQLATLADVAAIERVLTEEPGKPGAESIRRELLPRISPAHAALLDLESRDVVQRRRGARALVQSAEAEPLTSGLLLRLRDLLTYEQDQQVWQSCLAALHPDAHAEAGPILLLAINQKWPDIQRMGVEVVARYPSPEAAMWLLPLLTDSQRSVRLAAIRAIAPCGNPLAIDGLPASGSSTAVPGLRGLMTDVDEEVRLAAVVAAATLHDELAMQELMRLAQHATPAMRVFAVESMANTGHPRFVETLIRMGWTESADPVKLSILKSLDTLTPVDRRPTELAGLVVNASIDDKIKAWARWGEAQRRRATAATSANDVR